MRRHFFPYLMAGYPSQQEFADVFDVTLNYADTIEVGLPFSDPVADGPILQDAAQRVLASAFQIDTVFPFLESRRVACGSHNTSIAIMTYANPVLAYNREEFLKACAQSGVSFLIVPDVPFEESAEWKSRTRAAGLKWIQFVSPVTRPERLRSIAESAEGFLYLLSLTGITGAGISGPAAIRQRAQEIRHFTKVPIALGFGIKSPADIVAYRDDVDAFIVGSKIVECINNRQPLDVMYREFQEALGER